MQSAFYFILLGVVYFIPGKNSYNKKRHHKKLPNSPFELYFIQV